MSSIRYLKDFDKRQLFRFFVDGRFQRKYRGWVGYEGGERGSVQAILNGFAYMLENFDLAAGLKSTYLLNLHRICMFNVETANPKSSPGDLRYLNCGMPFLARTTTLENLREILAMRRDDGTVIFNAARYARTANEFDADSLYQSLLREKNINYRNWYPNLDVATQHALDKKGTLQEFYNAKHYVQMMFASRMEKIVATFNMTIGKAEGREEKLYVIATLIRDLELLHPFPDGNCRVFACILLNQLLLYYEFYPAILDNPNLDGECSYREFVEEIRKGMDNTRALLEDPNLRLFDFSITDASAEEIETFLRMAKGFIQKIDEFKEIYLNPERLQRITGGEWFNCDPFLRFTGTGSHNSFRAGFLYFGISLPEWKEKGLDIAKEIEVLFRKGIRAIVLDDAAVARRLPYPALLVNDVAQAYKDAAIAARQEVGCKTVLITGTEGKTGAKVQLYHLLQRQTRAHAALNSANTEIPVLRSLANLAEDDVVEINEVSVGSNEEMRVERARMVNPEICFFTNIGPNHMDMHKTIENLILAKSSVVEGLRTGGICIVNREIQYYDRLVADIQRRRSDVPLFLYGSREGLDARLVEAVFQPERFGWDITADIEGETVSYFIPYFQGHAPLASVGVLFLVKKLGFDVRQAARDYRRNEPYLTMGRLLVIHKQKDAILFYDQSRRGGMHGMTSAFHDLRNFKLGGKIVALVGGISIKKDSDWTREAHRNLAGLINESRIERLYTTGDYMEYVHEHLRDKSILVKHSDDLDELAADLIAECEHGDLLFIIGSAYLYLGRVADRILRKYPHELFDADTHAAALATRQPAKRLQPYEIVQSEGNQSLLVVFEGKGRQNGSEPFALGDITRDLPVDRIVLRDLDEAWHHHGIRGISRDIFGTIAFLKAKLAEKQYRRVCCVGRSAGGYAALLVGSSIKADQIHAFSPHTFLDQVNRELHQDHRWAAQLEARAGAISPVHRDLAGVLRTSLDPHTSVHIHYCDQDHLEKTHAEHLQEFSEIRFHPWRGKKGEGAPCANMPGGPFRVIRNALSDVNEPKMVSVWRDIAEGFSEGDACARNSVEAELFEKFKETYKDLGSFQGGLLLNFFKEIEQYLVAAKNFRPVNDQLRESGEKRHLYSDRLCREWFENVGKGRGERRVQLFGCFVDFGHPAYVLHITVGSSNLHVGIACWSQDNDIPMVGPMAQLDGVRITGKLNNLLPRAAWLKERTWWPVWCSIDCGNFIDLEQDDVYLTMANFRQSRWFAEKLTPLLEVLPALS